MVEGQAVRSPPELEREIEELRSKLAHQKLAAQELNHRIANSLQLAVDLLIFEEQRSLGDPAAEALASSRARLIAVAELHRYLHLHGGSTAVGLDEFLIELCSNIERSTGLHCRHDLAPLMVPREVAQQLAIAINECAINAAKHAFGRAAGGTFFLKVWVDAGELHVRVRDSGPGLAEGFDPDRQKGLGLSIVAATVRQIGGRLTVAGGQPGAPFNITVPIAWQFDADAWPMSQAH